MALCKSSPETDTTAASELKVLPSLRAGATFPSFCYGIAENMHQIAMTSPAASRPRQQL